jgi:hypothetical protein
VDGGKVLDSENTSSVLNMVLNTINNEFQHACHDQAVRLLNAPPIHQSTDYHVPGHNSSIAGMSGTKFLVHQVWANWFIMRRWVWDAEIPGVLVVDEMGLGKIFTLVAVVILCELVTEKGVMGLPLSILWGNIL